LLESYKQYLTEFFIHYGDCDDMTMLNKQLFILEIQLREKAYHYIRRSIYEPQDVLDVLDTIKDTRFLEEGLAGVDIRNKELIMTKMHTIFKNLRNYMGILKNWDMKMKREKPSEKPRDFFGKEEE